MEQNAPIPTSSVPQNSFAAVFRKLSYIVSNICDVVDTLPRQTQNGIDLQDVSKSLRQSYHQFGSQGGADSITSFPPRVNYFILRVLAVFCHPFQFATVFLDSCLLVHSLWGGRRPGPDFILPMSSLLRRPSGRLSRLLVQHSRDVPQYEVEAETSLPKSTLLHIVAVIDLSEVPQHITLDGYTTGADIYGLMSIFVFVAILNILLAPSWVFSLLALHKMLTLCGMAFMGGDGTLTLRQSEAYSAPTPAYAMLFDEDFSIMLRGTRELVDAITLRGFHFSYPVAGLIHLPVRKYIIGWLLQGGFQGLFYLMGILPVWRLLQPSFISHLSQVLGAPALFQSFMIITSWPTVRRTFRRHGTPREAALVLADICVAALRSMARTVPLVVSWHLYIHDYAVYNELQLLLDLFPSLLPLLILSLPTQNYPVRTQKFLDVLGNPPVRKWRFRTPAAAATFQCLVLCHGIHRPVRSIDIRGVLDTLIPDQRDVWRVWKERVADRVAHEEDIIFAPTLPTFRDAARQGRLKAYLDQAQYAYEVYRHRYKPTPTAQVL